METTVGRSAGWVVGLMALLAAGVASAGELWTENAQEAMAQAAKEDKDLLVDFTGSDWCGWCVKLDQEVFSQPAFQAAARKHFVFLKLDFPHQRALSAETKKQNEEWQQKFQIEGFPTIILADAEGKQYGRTGYRPGGPAAYLKHLAELQGARPKREKKPALAKKADSPVRAKDPEGTDQPKATESPERAKVREGIERAKGMEGIERAKALDEALSALDPSVVRGAYADAIEEIVKLDPENQAGLKAKYAGMLVVQKIGAAMQARELDKAIALADDALKTLGAKGQSAQEILYLKGLAQFRNQDKAAAKQSLQDALQAAPDTPKAVQIRKFLLQAFKE